MRVCAPVFASHASSHRRQAYRCSSPVSAADLHDCPPSIETSTPTMVPSPAQANPNTVWVPAVSCAPSSGLTIMDLHSTDCSE